MNLQVSYWITCSRGIYNALWKLFLLCKGTAFIILVHYHISVSCLLLLMIIFMIHGCDLFNVCMRLGSRRPV